MKKILFSLLVILAVVSVASVVSYAGWSDTDKSEDNEIKAGSLELEWSTDNGSTWTTEAPTATQLAVNATPGDTGIFSVLVRNAGGTVDGTFTVDNVNFTGAGELDQFIDITFQMQRDSDSAWTGRTDNKTGLTSDDDWDFGGVTLEKDGTAHELKLTWKFVDKQTGTNGADINDTMGDSVFVNFDGVLTQK